MKENSLTIVSNAAKWLTLLIIGLTPLLFLPNTFDFFELPKSVFLWVAAALLLVFWLLRMVAENEVKFVRTPIDIALIIFAIVVGIATFLSASRYTSVVGFFGRTEGGLASTLALIIIFYVAIASLRTLQDAVWAITVFLGSAGILAVLALLYYFGFHVFPWQAANIPIFSPAGGVYAVTVFLAMSIPVGLGTLLYLRSKQALVSVASTSTDGITAGPAKRKNIEPIISVLLCVSVILSFGAVILLTNTPALTGVGAAAVVFFLWSKRGQVRATSPHLLAIMVVLGLWLAFTKLPQIQNSVPQLKQKLDYPLILKADESWYIAGGALRDLPLFGSGPATYLFDFTRYHSQRYNLADTWNLRFVVAHDQYLQVLTTMGIFGLLAYLFVVVRLVLFGFKEVLARRDNEYYPLKVGIFAGVTAYLVATLFVASSTTTMTAFFVLAALLMVFERLSQSNLVAERKIHFVLTSPGQMVDNKPVNVIPVLLLIPGILIAITVLVLSAQYVRANTAYVKGVAALSSNDPNAATNALKYQEQAANLNRFEDGYQRDLAKTSFTVALALSQKKDITDKDKGLVTALVQNSIARAQLATNLSPLNVNNWQTLADIYRRIAGQVNGAGDVALQAFQRAILTDPQNPQQYLDAGGIFFAANAYDRAIDAFKQAANLKPNMANAYYNLANAYVKKGDYNNAWGAYLAVSQLLNQLPDSDQNKKNSLTLVEKEMAAIQDKVTTQSAQPAANPQASATPQPTTTATPQPTRTGTPSPTPKASVITSTKPSATP